MKIGFRKILGVNLGITALVACAAFQRVDLTTLATTDSSRSILLTEDSPAVQELVSRQSSIGAADRAEAHRYETARIALLRELEEKRRAGADTSAIEVDLARQLQHPEAYIPERISFLKKIAAEPSFMVPPNTQCTIIQRSTAICSKHPDQNPVYVKVLITSGALKGRTGWGCEGDGIARSVTFP